MIKKYEKVSIIYGGSGLETAKKINDELNKLHFEQHYPIESTIIANKIVGGASIFHSVKQIISSSSLCIIILTFDDVEGTRVRQNVLVEIGMALMAIMSTDHCIFLSEKKSLPDDFPSDLKCLINPNYFDKNNLEEVSKNVCDEMIRILGNRNYNDILSNDNYIYNYENILSDIPEKVFEEKTDIQLEHVLDCWQDNIASFGFVTERIAYLLERLKFFPDFKCNEKFFNFIASVKQLINPTEMDYANADRVYINNICGFAQNLLDYTALKLDKKVISLMGNVASDREKSELYKNEFETIAQRFQKFVDRFENEPERFKYNWYIKVMAYEYLPLAEMKVVGFGDKYDESLLEKMNSIIGYYNKVIEMAEDYGAKSADLWRGYAEYNLTRTYEVIYKITHDKKYYDKIRFYSLHSIATRRAWCNKNSFKGVFSNALSFEYFLVKKHELELKYKLEGYSDLNKKEIVIELHALADELKHYCDATELGRLYDMRDNIGSLVSKIADEESDLNA